MSRKQFWNNPFFVLGIAFIVFLGFEIYGIARLIIDSNKYPHGSGSLVTDIMYVSTFSFGLLFLIFGLFVILWIRRRKS